MTFWWGFIFMLMIANSYANMCLNSYYNYDFAELYITLYFCVILY
jgi:hypothetical protein